MEAWDGGGKTARKTRFRDAMFPRLVEALDDATSIFYAYASEKAPAMTIEFLRTPSRDLTPEK